MGNSFAAQLVEAIEHSWPAIARPNQLSPPGNWWQVWLLLAGRGFGNRPQRRHDRNHPPGAVRFSDEKNWCHHIRKPKLFNCIQQAKR